MRYNTRDDVEIYVLMRGSSMEKFIDGNFKDDSPLSTVEKIRNILKSNGIEVEEQWIETQVPYCFALLLKIKGLNFSTSGKGLSREFALASAYGEMIERVVLSARRNETIDSAYMETMFNEVRVLYKLDEFSASGAERKLGKLPALSVGLIVALAAVWVCILVYFVIDKVKKQKNQEKTR